MSLGGARSSRLAPALLAAAGGAAAAFLPFWRLRPNRISRGQAVYLAAAEPAALSLIAVLWLGYFLLASRGRRSRLAAALATVCVAIAFAATAHAAAGLAGSSGIARLSLGPGFWLLCLASYSAYVLAERGPGSPLPLPGRAARLGTYFPLACGSLLAVLALGLLLSGALEPLAVVREWKAQSEVFFHETRRHLALTGACLLLGGIVGASVGIAAPRGQGDRGALFAFLNIVQTMPSLALFGLLILPLAALAERFPALRDWGIGGIGAAPALIALSLYAALPIARNTWAGLEGVPAAARDAGRGMGMGAFQVFMRVELPLALPVALAGLRTAAVQAVGNVAIAALIGAGGLGVFIFQGLGQFAMDMVLAGTLPLIAMALAADAALGGLSRALEPRGMRAHAAPAGGRP